MLARSVFIKAYWAPPTPTPPSPSSSPSFVAWFLQPLLAPEVDETVGGLRDGRERLNGRVADRRRGNARFFVVVPQIDDVAEREQVNICPIVLFIFWWSFPRKIGDADVQA